MSPRLFRPRVRRARARRALLIQTLEDRAVPATASFGSLAVDSTQAPTDLLVRFKTGYSGPGLTAPAVLANNVGAESLGLVDGLIRVPVAGAGLVDALAAYRANPNVLYAEPNYRLSVGQMPNDPQFNQMWGLHNTGQSGGVPDADIDAPEAWDLTTGSTSTVVAVIDTGIDYLHPDLAANMWRNPGEVAGNNRDDDNNGFIDDVFGADTVNNDGNPLDDNDHGTHVAGIIGAASNNGVGVTGIAWNVRLMAVKSFDATGSGSVADAVEAINYAVSKGAVVANASWGGNEPFSQALYDAIQKAREAGQVFVAGAGNGNFIGIGQDNDADPFYPASFDLDNIVAVAATDRNDGRAFFSNYGATSVDLGAPGVDIRSTIRSNGYETLSGTSMATPHVTGVIALVRSQHPDWTYQQVISKVLNSVDPVPSMAGRTTTGGRLNALTAVTDDLAGPRVLSTNPWAAVSGPVSSVRVTFSEPVDPATFTAADVTFTGPSGTIPVTAVSVVPGTNNRRFDVTFAPRSTLGGYSLTFGPNVLDFTGNPMNQDGDATNGEPEDAYTATFSIVPFAGRWDFGISTSAVADGYRQVLPNTAYTAALGFGWQAGTVFGEARPAGTELTADLNYGRDITFAANVPDGTYQVAVTMGDTGPYVHEQMAVWIEAAQRDTVTTAAGQVVTRTFQVPVRDGQLTLRLQDLGGPDLNAVINALEVVYLGPTGPRVVSAVPGGSVTGPVDRVTFTFDEPIQDGSFTLADVSGLTGPGGPIAPLAVNRLTSTQYEVTFAPQATVGDYSVTIGPDIRDAAGNRMDQDADGTLGEPIDDRYTALFRVVPFVGRYDFGTATSPVAGGYTRVSPASAYNVGTGFGWLGGGLVEAVDRNTGSDLTRDLVYGPDLSFVTDVPNGVYDVTVTVGDAGPWAHDQMALSLEGTQVAVLNTPASVVQASIYRVTINDGQLALRLRDLGGDPNAVLVALDVVWASPDPVGPRVISASLAGTTMGPVDRVTLTFDEPIQDGTFTLADVTLTGPGGPIAPFAVNELTDTRYEVIFPAQSATGDYSLTGGPDVRDRAGNLMDQDADGTNGEALQDRFTTNFRLVPFVGRYDFDTPTSPLAAGYTRVTPASSYTASSGFGWLGGGLVEAVERTTGTDLTRDLAYGTDLSFATNVPNGSYDVTLAIGDPASYAHDQMALSLEGATVATINTAAGEVKTLTYRVTVNDGQLSLRLRDLGGNDVYTVLNGLDVVWAGPDPVGPRVVAATPGDTSMGPIDRVTLMFDEAVQDGTFTLSDVSVAGPAGAIIPTAVNRLTNMLYEVVFPAQTATGNYAVTVGPDIRDVAGNLMDQDGDGVPGETIQDRFTALFTLVPFVGWYDFGPAGSPVASGYRAVTPATNYTPGTGYGWLGGGVVDAAQRTTGSDLTRDLVFGPDLSFVTDLPNGAYDVTITIGDTGQWAHDQMALSIEGTELAVVNTAAFEVKTLTYRVAVNDGQLSLRLRDLGGGDMNAVLNGLDVVWAGPDVLGPRVTAVNPTSEVLGMVDRVTLTFNESIQDGSFTLADVASFTGPAGPIVATGVNQLSDTRYEVTFAPQTADGDYSLIVGPDVRDAAGNLMDQDGDGTAGEPTQDRFTAFFRVASAVRFDFGTASSPVASGYRQVVPTRMYSAGAGFGWLTTGVEAVDRGTGTELTRDLAYGRDLQFAADVPNGTYDVTVTVGDTGPYQHDLMAVSLEGTQQETLNTSGGQVLARTYRVAVNDGQLSFRLQDLGGSDANAVLMGLDVVWFGPDTVGPRVVAGPAGTLMGPVDRVTLTFDEAIQEGSFTASDVAVSGPGGPIAVTGVNRLSDTQYDVAFAPQSMAGSYTVTVGPDVHDRAGNLMDQDRDGTAGEPTDDQYAATFALSSAMRFDFGTATSPLASGYARVTETTNYTAALAYGWQGGGVFSVDRGIGPDLTRDLVYGNDLLFAVDLPNGTYDVTVTIGDPAPYQHDHMALSLEGVQLATLSTAGGEVLTRTYRVVVSDGQLSFRLRDAGGSDYNVVLNALEIVRVGPGGGTDPVG